VFEGLDISIGDQVVETDVVPQCGEPELGDAGWGGRNVLGEGSVVFFFLLCRSFLAGLNLFGGCGCFAIDNGASALVERFFGVRGTSSLTQDTPFCTADAAHSALPGHP